MLKARPSDRPPIQKNGKLKNPISKNKSFNFNKFDYKKLISRLLLFSILLSIIAVFVAPLFINLRVWKPEIVVLLEGITDKKAFIDGDVSLSIFPTPEISVEKVRLVNATGNYDRDFLKLDEIRANITFGSLFRGKVVVEKIKLNGFEIITFALNLKFIFCQLLYFYWHVKPLNLTMTIHWMFHLMKFQPLCLSPP